VATDAQNTDIHYGVVVFSAVDVMCLQNIDPKTHPAWTGQHREIKSGGQVSKFNKRFANLGVKKT